MGTTDRRFAYDWSKLEYREAVVDTQDREALGIRSAVTHFSRYKVKNEPLEAWVLRDFRDSETDHDYIM